MSTVSTTWTGAGAVTKIFVTLGSSLRQEGGGLMEDLLLEVEDLAGAVDRGANGAVADNDGSD